MEKEKTKIYQKWWFWVIVAVIIIGIVAIIVLGGKDSNIQQTGTTSTSYFSTNNNKQNTEGQISEAKLKENIKIEFAGMTKAGDFVIKVINNNNKAVYIDEITTIYKNNDNVFMKKETSDENYFGIEANSEVYVHNWGFQENFAQYPKYEFNLELSGDWLVEESIVGKYEIKANDTGKNIALEIKNNNNVSVQDVQVGVVFYKNNEIVGYENGIDYDSKISTGNSAYINIDYPENSDYKKVSFDNYKVYVLNSKKAN